MLHRFTGQIFLDILVHMQDGEQMYIIHMQTQSTSAKVHSQKAVLCLCADEQSGGRQKAPQGQRAGISTVCHFLLEQKERRGQHYKKESKRGGSAVSGHLVLGVIFSRS